MVELRIAFIYDAAYPWNVGGIEMMEDAEARELAKQYEVHYFSLRWPGMKAEFKHNGITYHTFHDMTVSKFYQHGRRSIRQALIFAVGLFRLFKYRFDVIVVNQFPMVHLIVLRLYCSFTGCKMVMDVAEVWNRDYWINYLGYVPGLLANAYAEQAVRWGDAYTVLSDQMKRRLVQRGIHASRVSVFAPVVENSSIESSKARSRQIFISGRLVKEKRLDKWLQVVKAVKQRVPSVKAVIRGDGPEKRDLARLIKKFGLEHTVKLMPFARSKATIDRELRNSSLVLQMSEREGLSMIVLESIKHGTPVVLPDYSPIPDEVQSMCVVAPESQLASKIVKMLSTDHKSRFIRNTQMLDLYAISRIRPFYTQLFNRLLNSKQ